MVGVNVGGPYTVCLVEQDMYTLGHEWLCRDSATKRPLEFKTRSLARKFSCKMLKELPEYDYAKIYDFYPVEVIERDGRGYIARINDMPKYDRKEVRISPKTGGLRGIKTISKY